jgi:uncharacterized CHY-type Zn-finger protein
MLFKTYIKLMVLEFPDEQVKEIAEVLDSEWLLCSACHDAWESTEFKDALVCCTNCGKLFNNLRYR